MSYRSSKSIPWGSEEDMDPYQQRRSNSLAVVALQLAQSRSNANNVSSSLSSHSSTALCSTAKTTVTASLPVASTNILVSAEENTVPLHSITNSILSKRSYEAIMTASYDGREDAKKKNMHNREQGAHPHHPQQTSTDDAENLPLLSPSKVKKVPPGYIQKRALLVNESLSRSSLEWKQKAAMMNRYEEWVRTAKSFRTTFSSSSSDDSSSITGDSNGLSSSLSVPISTEDSSASFDTVSPSNESNNNYLTYFRQSDAFQSIDNVYRKSSSFHPSSSPSTTGNPNYKVFSVEINSAGKRKFIVAHIDTFWSRYAQSKVRHFYEILREDTPVHLYFDIEYRKLVSQKTKNDNTSNNTTESIQELNKGVDRDKVLGYFMYRVAKALYHNYGVLITWDHIVHLESSTNQKFSRHILVRLPNGAMFRDTAHAGEFVMQIVEDCSNDLHRKHQYRQQAKNGVPFTPDTSIEDNTLLTDEEEELVHSLWIETLKNGPTLNGPCVPSVRDSPMDHLRQDGTSSPVSTEDLLNVDWNAITEDDWLKFEQGIPLCTAKVEEKSLNDSSSASRSSMTVSSSSSILTETDKSTSVQREFIVDLGVYTKNRAMRMYMSSKYDKDVYLLPAGSNRYILEKSIQVSFPSIPDKERKENILTVDYWLQGTKVVTTEELRCMDKNSNIAGESYSLLLQPSRNDDASLIQIGNCAWEERMWKASLITDCLPPLTFSVLQPSEENVSRSRLKNPSYNPETHPLYGFPLLYCWPRTNKNEETILLSSPGVSLDILGSITDTRALASRAGRFRGNQSLQRTEIVDSKYTSSKSVSAYASRLPPARIVEGGTNIPPFYELTEWLKFIASGPLPSSSSSPSNENLSNAASISPGSNTIVTSTVRTKGMEYNTKEMTMEGLITQRIPASIRTWSMKVRDLTYKVPHRSTEVTAESISPSTALSYEYVKYPIVSSITYQINGSRYCHRVHRHHRSNNVYWIVNLESGTATQACFDYECRSFRSVPLSIPLDILPDQGPIGGILQLEENNRKE